MLSREPWLDDKPLGQAGAYEKVWGRAYFAVDPSHPANQRIADITLAPHNAQAQVEFWGNFVVLHPWSRPRHVRRLWSRFQTVGSRR